MERVLRLYKKEGETPLETIKRFKKENPEYGDLKLSIGQRKMTYAGRLDPMAEGILIVLVGEECKNKEKYLVLDKEYEFEVLWGFETDTYDILGIPSSLFLYSQEYKNNKFNFEMKIVDFLKNIKGKQIFEYPSYSSATVDGKQLHQWSREGRLDEIEIPKKEVEIYNIEFLGNKEVLKKDLLKNIAERIEKVSGDFRQKEIISEWTKILTKDNFTVTGVLGISKFRVKCSSGTYVRAIVNRLGREVGVGAIAFSIKRTKIFKFDF